MTEENWLLTNVCSTICCLILRAVKSMPASITSIGYGKKMPTRNRHSLCSAICQLLRMTEHFPSITTSGRNWLREVFQKVKWNSYTKPTRIWRKRNCSKRPVRERSECFLALLRRWEQERMCRINLSHFTMWIVRGDLQIWSSVPAELSVRAMKIRR